MSMRKLFTCFVCAGLLLATASAGLANSLQNPGFETGDLTNWQVFGLSPTATVTVTTDNGPSAPGTHAAYMDNRQEALGLTLKQTTAPGTAAGGTVDWSFDLKVGQAANGGVFFVQVFAEQSGVGIVGTSGLLGNYVPAAWTHYSGSFTAPAGTDFLSIQFMANTGAVAGSVSTMYIDNVSLVQPDAVPTQATTWGDSKDLYR